jgi:hypothetical protein
MIRQLVLVCGISVLFSVPCQASSDDIYQYTDDSGVIHFSNVNVASGKKFKRLKSSRSSSSRIEQRTAAPAAEEKSATRSAPSTYTELIRNACDRHGVDPDLVHAIVKVESDFNPFALSKKGAVGLMQLMPQTADILNIQNIFSPDENIEGGVRYLRYLLDRYEGNLSLALAAYNSGETAVQKWGTIPPFPETQNYVRKILHLYNGAGTTLTPRSTIFISYGEDGALMFTDDPYKQPGKKSKKKQSKNL